MTCNSIRKVTYLYVMRFVVSRSKPSPLENNSLKEYKLFNDILVTRACVPPGQQRKKDPPLPRPPFCFINFDQSKFGTEGNRSLLIHSQVSFLCRKNAQYPFA